MKAEGTKPKSFRGVGKWKLPQPLDVKEGGEWSVLPKVQSRIPFGYTVSECGRFIEPIPKDLDALEEAFKYLKTYTATDVQKWLKARTGKRLSVQTLIERWKRKRRNNAKARLYRRWAKDAAEALQAAQELEAKRPDGERVKVPKVKQQECFARNLKGEYVCTECGYVKGTP